MRDGAAEFIGRDQSQKLIKCVGSFSTLWIDIEYIPIGRCVVLKNEYRSGDHFLAEAEVVVVW